MLEALRKAGDDSARLAANGTEGGSLFHEDLVAQCTGTDMSGTKASPDVTLITAHSPASCRTCGMKRADR